MKTGSKDVLLARKSVIESRKDTRETSQDNITFANCHEFAGEANLLPEGKDTVRTAEPRNDTGTTIALPSGLTISLLLQTPIDIKTSAVGDKILATVEDDVRDAERVWLPKGSTVDGRIRRIERRQWEVINRKALDEGFKFGVNGGSDDYVQQHKAPYPAGSTEAWSWYSGFIEGKSRRQMLNFGTNDPVGKAISPHAEESGYVLAGLEFSLAETRSGAAQFVAQLESVERTGGLSLNHSESLETRHPVAQSNKAWPAKVLRFGRDSLDHDPATGFLLQKMFCASESPRCAVTVSVLRESVEEATPRVGYIYLTAAPFVAPAGLRTIWTTVKP